MNYYEPDFTVKEHFEKLKDTLEETMNGSVGDVESNCNYCIQIVEVLMEEKYPCKDCKQLNDLAK